MPVRDIQSNQNARLKELRKALTASGRNRSDLVAIEGPHLLEEALRAKLHIATIFIAQGAERLLSQLRLPPEAEILRLPRELLDSALATETPQPIAALVEPPQWSWSHLLDQKQEKNQKTTLIVVLAALQDPGNLGTILRSAEAFGASGIVTLPGTVSPWNPKAVRASAGSVFRVPLLAAGEDDCFKRLRQAGVKILATAVSAAQPAQLIDLTAPTALLIGNEGNGLSKNLSAKSDAQIKIPCPGPVESLNAAVAASLLLYEASRQRSALGGGPYDHRRTRR